LGSMKQVMVMVRSEAGFQRDVMRGIGRYSETHGPWRFPINVMPDHEHLYHAHRDAAWVQRWVRRKGFAGFTGIGGLRFHF